MSAFDCMYVCMPYVCLVSWSQQEGITPSGPGSIDGYEITMWMLENEPVRMNVLLLEKEIFLPSKQIFQPYGIIK